MLCPGINTKQVKGDFMTKILSICVCLLVTFASGCSSPQPKVAKGFTNASLDGAPGWVLDPTSAKGVAAVGSAQRSPGGIQFQRNEAMASGRDELSRMLGLRVKNMLSNFSRQTGVGEGQSFDKVTEDVSRQMSKETLNGSKQKDLWIAPDGTLFILVSLDPKSVADIAKQSVLTSMRNDKALYQQAEAKKALDSLDSAIDKEFTQ
jgi:hypothetical protein